VFFDVDNYPTPQHALDAAAAATDVSVVRFPPEPIPLAQPMIIRPTVASRVILQTTGTYLYGTSGNTRLLRSFADTDSFPGYDGHSRIEVHGGTWDCRGHELTGELPVAVAMNFVHGSDILVRDATIMNVVGGHAIEVSAINGARIEGCRFMGFRDSGGRAFSEAVQIGSSTSQAATSIGLWDGTPSKRIHISRCYVGASNVLGAYGALVGDHSSVAGVYHDSIRIIDCEAVGTVNAVHAMAWRDFVVAACNFSDTTGTAIFVENSRGGAIYGNAIARPGSNGVNVSGSDDILVEANRISDTTSNYGIWVGEASVDVQVLGNHVRGGATAGIRLSSGANRCKVGSNMVRKGGGGEIGISCGAGAGSVNRVVANDISGFDTPLAIQSGSILTS
jgi:hypothetical protein